MPPMAMQGGAGAGYVQRGGGGLYEIVDVLLDKGLVIDVFVRVSLVGIELLTVDARIVLASVDTYLRFAEAVNRLDLLQASNDEGLPELMQDMTSDGAESKTKGVLQGAKESLFGSDDDGNDSDEDNGDSDGGDSSSSSRGSSASARSGGSSSRSGGSGSRSGGSGCAAAARGRAAAARGRAVAPVEDVRSRDQRDARLRLWRRRGGCSRPERDRDRCAETAARQWR